MSNRCPGRQAQSESRTAQQADISPIKAAYVVPDQSDYRKIFTDRRL